LNVCSSCGIERVNALAESTRFEFRSLKASRLSASRPRVERFDVIATFWPPTVA
jgi:hypothetical protein